MDHRNSGAFSYVVDVSLLSPSRVGLFLSTSVCVRYAAGYDISLLFNRNKIKRWCLKRDFVCRIELRLIDNMLILIHLLCIKTQ